MSDCYYVMKQKLQIFLFLILCCLFMLTINVEAKEVYGDWEYTVSSGEARITKYLGTSTNVTIPSTLNKYHVVAVESYVFEGSNIKVLTVPAGLEYIGYGAFKNCYYLSNIYWNAKNCKVEFLRAQMGSMHAFVNAGKYSSGLKVTFGSSVERIPNCLFESNESNYARVTSVEISDSVKYIGSYAFSNCFDLTTVKFGKNIEKIESEAFLECHSLTSITIPATLEEMGYAVFKNCYNLSSIVWNAVDCHVSYTRSDASRFCFVNAGKYSGGIEVQFGPSVRYIPTCLFENNSRTYAHVTYVSIPDSVVKVGDFAFNNCLDLKKVVIMSKYAAFAGYNTYSDSFVNCSPFLTFHCFKGSTAETYARSAGYQVSYIKCTTHENLITSVKKATLTENGNISKKCSLCNTTVSTSIIYAAKNISISGNKYKYDGKEKKPTVTVKNSQGEVIPTSYYTVTYTAGRKNVGKYTVNIVFKGNYSGSKSLNYIINPPQTSISSLKGAKKSFKINWVKKSSQVTGYEVQYSLSKSFNNNNKKVKINSAKTTFKTINNLKAKKKYYVRIRSYKNVGNTVYYSDWSTSKSVTTKS